MLKYLSIAAVMLAVSGKLNAQNKYVYTADLANIQKDQVAVTLTAPPLGQENLTFSFAKAIPGSYARKDFGRFITDFQALDASGKKLKVEKLNKNQYSIANAKSLATIKYNVSDTWDVKHEDFIFQPGGSNIEAGANVVMNNHAFYGYFEGYTKLPVEITVTKPADFYASTHLDVTHKSAQQDVITAKDFVYLADNPVIYSKPDTISFYVGKSKINVTVYSATGKVKSGQVASYLKPTANALDKFFNGLPVSSYQFLFFFEDPKRALADRKKGEGGYGALEHNYSSLYYLPEVDYEKELISMVNDVSSHEFLHIFTPLNLHSKEIDSFDFTDPKMSQHLWLYEGVTEYFAHLVQLQNGITTEKDFFKEMRSKMNQAEEFGDFSMTEMSKRVLEDEWQKKYGSVYNRGALIGFMLDQLIREKTNGQKDLKQVIMTLAKKYGPSRPFNDDELFAEFVAASHPDVKQFIEAYIAGGQKLPYQEYFAKVGYEYAPEKAIPVYYPGKMGLKYENSNFIFANVDKNALNIKEGDIFKRIDNIDISANTVDEAWDKYFSQNTEHPEMAITVVRNGQEQVLKGKVYEATLKSKNNLSPLPTATPAQQAALKGLTMAKGAE